MLFVANSQLTGSAFHVLALCDGALVSRARGLQDSVPRPHPGVRLRWRRRGSLL